MHGFGSMGSKAGLNIRFYRSVQNGYLGKSWVHLYVIMHEIIRFFFVDFSIYLGAFKKSEEKVRCVNLGLFESVQNRHVE